MEEEDIVSFLDSTSEVEVSLKGQEETFVSSVLQNSHMVMPTEFISKMHKLATFSAFLD